ncbi:thiolase-like protein [Aspergillus neoniger CBS 115656]|uniref:Thiolase-like protein n=1 Tax=Aspergillus neoniger (strain CBS 115656) TaxID=1448310 RepID=A0A318YPU6_ASPNB|nr:thiolase-like protein [Aspergillus neoniger CBS 115656]PYH34753.1 thiolase-like protein [Aspergillus neoniger CBS 115656]
MFYPSADAQENLIRRAYRDAGIASTPLFECHGTDTVAGGTTEGTVIAKLTDRRSVFLGVVKPNLGHAEGVSGINSIMNDRPEGVNINSFGIGGSNAHVILKSADYYMKSRDLPIRDKNIAPSDKPQIILISANTKASLDARIQRLTTYPNSMEKDYLLCDLSHALAVRRRHLIYRVFVIARPDVELTEQGSIRSL